MSGHSDMGICPNCEQEAHVYVDWKPFDITSTECHHCGFYAYTKVEYLDLDGLNAIREEYDLEPLTKLPHQDLSI